MRVHDTGRDAMHELTPGPTARMYVCGITPYDATHMGHASTYVTFDLVNRVLRQAGHEVLYAQNITDVDDPLLERAHRDGVDWTALATKEIQLFRDDMTALRVLPPDHYVGVVESVGAIADQVCELAAAGLAYPVPVGPEEAELVAEGAQDYYLDLSQLPTFGQVSHYDDATMAALFAERGGDPERPGKRDPLDPLLWRAERTGEPAWNGCGLGSGRPGWHIECTTIALEHLGVGFDVQGGGTDLIFPHHEMSAVQSDGLTGHPPFAQVYLHQAMVGLDGEKMSKSRGNLVLVSRLRLSGTDPMAIRLVLLDQHYRTDWEWTDGLLEAAQQRLARWRGVLCGPVAGVAAGGAGAGGEGASGQPGPAALDTVEAMRAALTDDLRSQAALAAIDAYLDDVDAGRTTMSAADRAHLVAAIDAWLGIAL
ncbi:L-cysteine:1D-myo-inositol 2-amino-2-deoxy-alpha-D-glucopyranoside ligase [Arsenicicoccus piscis]|uniref:L-cysteine:1D-myo-inositol 2-amino-2-deoxy-alpha-D-glucopyranoside ligase n=1 Tax=Arsenicicoccus piscis TaxID=673954 RepID=A0ABQ6HQL9_9MICO|nr:L-cysteine:1D-myo-inositol 2-amino-2-deoxy-alpha-D-glucopyranoside ligase [Arsenicicoccus piscis]